MKQLFARSTTVKTRMKNYNPQLITDTQTYYDLAIDIIHQSHSECRSHHHRNLAQTPKKNPATPQERATRDHHWPIIGFTENWPQKGPQIH